jgi:hypothetical protein
MRGTREFLGLRSVVIAKLGDEKGIVSYFVDEPVLVSDAS